MTTKTEKTKVGGKMFVATPLFPTEWTDVLYFSLPLR